MSGLNIYDEMIFEAASERIPDEIKLLNLELAVVSGLDGEKTVKEVADSLDLNLDETKNILDKLIVAGLVKKIENANRFLYVPVEIIAKIEDKLTLIMGPVAPVIVDDVLIRLNKRKNNLNKSSLALFIDLLTNNISNHKKQHQFQISIWDDINHYFE